MEMNWIELLAEPDRLYLAWQAPDHLGNRFRWAVGVIERHVAGASFRYLRSGSEFERLNQSKGFDELRSLGFEGYPAFKLRQQLQLDGVMEALMRRLPPRSRTDFLEFRRQFRLSDNVKISDFALLAQTEAKLPSDGFSLVDPLNPKISKCDLMLEVAGLRYYVPKDHDLERYVGNTVDAILETDNAYDRNAVKLVLNGQKIGFINRLQAETFGSWLSNRQVSVVLERVNGTRDRPRGFIFVRVRPMGQEIAA